MGTVILIRHARSTANAANVLAGQSPGIRLDPTGIEQSKSLADTLGALPIDRVFVSPLERCVETITPWLSKFGKDVVVHSEPRIIEPDYGMWSGRSLEELALEKSWIDVQNNPALVTFPNGERFIDVWDRVTDFFTHLSELANAGGNYIVVSHGDIIKFLLAHVLKIEFVNFQSLVVEPASISIAHFADEKTRLVQFNRSDQKIGNLVTAAAPATLGGESASQKQPLATSRSTEKSQ